MTAEQDKKTQDSEMLLISMIRNENIYFFLLVFSMIVLDLLIFIW